MFGLRLQDGEDRVFASVNPPGPSVSAHRSRPRLALLAFKHTPPAHAGRAHPEPLAHLTATQTLRYRSQNANAKVHRKRSPHVRRPPSRRQLESSESRFGNPPRFNPLGYRSHVASCWQSWNDTSLQSVVDVSFSEKWPAFIRAQCAVDLCSPPLSRSMNHAAMKFQILRYHRSQIGSPSMAFRKCNGP
jgi:hypothetical protein